MKCKICQKNQTTSSSGICWECLIKSMGFRKMTKDDWKNLEKKAKLSNRWKKHNNQKPTMKQHIKPCNCKTCLKKQKAEYQKGFIDGSEPTKEWQQGYWSGVKHCEEYYKQKLQQQRKGMVKMIEKMDYCDVSNILDLINEELISKKDLINSLK